MSTGDKYYGKRDHCKLVRELQEGKGGRLSLYCGCSGKISLIKWNLSSSEGNEKKENRVDVLGKSVLGRATAKALRQEDSRADHGGACRPLKDFGFNSVKGRKSLENFERRKDMISLIC